MPVPYFLKEDGSVELLITERGLDIYYTSELYGWGTKKHLKYSETPSGYCLAGFIKKPGTYFKHFVLCSFDRAESIREHIRACGYHITGSGDLDPETGDRRIWFLIRNISMDGEGVFLNNVWPQETTLNISNKLDKTDNRSYDAGVKSRTFAVEFTPDSLRIENIVVATAKAGTQMKVFGILWRQFLDDLAAELSPDDFRPISLKSLTDTIDQGGHDATDVLTIRRAVNRLQNDVMKKMHLSLGLSMNRDDIIQYVRPDGQRRKGYRINPHVVLTRAKSTF